MTTCPSLPDDTLLHLALEAGLPPFLDSIPQSHALNATPYLIDWEVLVRIYRRGARVTLVDGLEAVLHDVAAAGARVVAVLLGGSFVRPGHAHPRDLDGVCFYEGGNADTPAALLRLAAEGKDHGIDIRFIPLDANPVVALKACAFFATLYARDRRSPAVSHGCLLVTP